MTYKRPALTADCVVFDRAGRLLLIKRGHAPFKGKWALPGGYVDYGERVEDAALRELKEETGIEGRIVRLVGVYSDPKRDPRGHTISTAFLVRPKSAKAASGDDAEHAEFVADWRSLTLAFDHNAILADALKLRR